MAKEKKIEIQKIRIKLKNTIFGKLRFDDKIKQNKKVLQNG